MARAMLSKEVMNEPNQPNQVVPPLRWWWVAVGLALVASMVLPGLFSRANTKAVAYSEFQALVSAGQVSEVTVSPTNIIGRVKNVPTGWPGPAFSTLRVDDPELTKSLAAAGATIRGAPPTSPWGDVAVWVLPALLMVWLFRQPLRGPASSLAFGRSTARLSVESKVKARFSDVAGVDEAKDELREVIDFLRAPQKFRRLGGHMPKGILLVGPPGTGKTLLARAVAGEASVPFFNISGSEFVELFVGVGASRVRDLFREAKKVAPCIIFVDELDALGKMRGIGPMAHEEREQTLNQLLVELDGFDARDGVVLMAATNRPEILDPALLRAGRFDRQVLVDRPDRTGRLAILKVHARQVSLEHEEDLQRVASMTPGLAGAELANIVNEAALLAVRHDRAAVTSADFDEAIERIVAGLAKRNRLLTPAERERVAVHEVGHAIVGLSVAASDPVQKISIIPRGIAALGYTMQVPAEDRRLFSKPELEAKLAVLLAGRSAEMLVLHSVSTGAEDDIAKATQIARSMVKSYGMSRTLGAIRYEPNGRPALEGFGEARAEYGEEVARELDREVHWLIERQEARARQVLMAQEPAVRAATQALLERESLSGEELGTIIAAATPSAPSTPVAALDPVPVAAAFTAHQTTSPQTLRPSHP